MRTRPQLLILVGALSLSAVAAPILASQAAATDRVIVVQPGQTLSEIAVREGVTIQQLVELNGLRDPNRIFAGQTLRVEVEAAPAPAAPAAAAPAAPAAATHRVAWGETLWGIARRHGTTVSALVAANGIANPSRIRTGQVLAIPGSATAQVAPATAASAPAPTAATHRVAWGETLWGIARRHGTTVSALVAANGIANPSRIRTGQVLAIPGSATAQVAPATAESAPAPAAATHRVAWGETLWGIARRYGTTVSALAAANGIANPSHIRTGQVLAIPGGTITPPAAQPAAPAPAVSPGAPNGAMPADMAALVARRQEVARLIVAEAGRQGVPAAFALAVAWQESGWQPRVVSSAGAIGVMQLLPATGEWVGGAMLGRAVNLWDPAQNVQAGVRLLKHYLDRYNGSRALVLAAYYQGQTAADRHGVYPVTRPYIASILRLEEIFSR